MNNSPKYKNVIPYDPSIPQEIRNYLDFNQIKIWYKEMFGLPKGHKLSVKFKLIKG